VRRLKLAGIAATAAARKDIFLLGAPLRLKLAGIAATAARADAHTMYRQTTASSSLESQRLRHLGYLAYLALLYPPQARWNRSDCGDLDARLGTVKAAASSSLESQRLRRPNGQVTY